MYVNAIPALSDELERLAIDPGLLLQALERYAEQFSQFVELNHDQYERPIEWLDVKDMEKTVNDFVALLPKICPIDEDFTIEEDDE
ncbi:hypothetical protein ACO2Q8_16665 [Larkinella sp. VNQ87]|uniref:hypothetical protein n=1 Tax=Larkinella sp. VNQ87 TaxID=3400921 RepID=UPI003C00E9C6